MDSTTASKVAALSADLDALQNLLDVFAAAWPVATPDVIRVAWQATDHALVSLQAQRAALSVPA